jgi:uncharacterized protein (DUF2384 family)
MGLNTKCPFHGNEHPDFACPDLETSKKVLEFLEHQSMPLMLEILERKLGKAGAQAWLKTPHASLDDMTPQYLIDGGKEEFVFDLVADMFTGNPA